jgi:outer membrane protein assembly factor BamB
MTKRLVAIVAAAFLVGGAAAAFLLTRGHHRGAATTVVRTTAARKPPQAKNFAWPAYGFDLARTHAAPPLGLRPPFRTIWTVHGDWSLIEFPPVLDGGRLFLGTNHGLVLAIQAGTGRILWERRFAGCVAASPAVGNAVVYLGFMDPPPCRGSAPSFLAALDARTGKTLWRFRCGVVETPPLLAGGRVYFGSWDHRVYALSQVTGRVRWTFNARAPISGAPTVLDGLVYFSSCGSCSTYEQNPRARRTFAVRVRTGRLAWRFPDGEYSPVIADRRRVYLTGFTHLYGLVPK